MTPEHKALVERANEHIAMAKSMGNFGVASKLVEELASALSALCGQPQAGEVVAWRYKLFVADVDWTVSTTKPKGAIVEPLYASPQSANPAQVTELIEDLEQAVIDFENARSDTYNRAKKELQRARAALTAAIGACGQAVAADIGDAILAWMVKYDLLDGDNEYQVADVMAVMDDLVPSSALSQPHPADERVVEALEVTVPKEPSRGRLISMAIRYNHAFLINPDPNAAWSSGVKPENREAILRSMRQLYEEAIGEGFYSPDREDGYVASFEKAQASAQKDQKNG